MATLQTAQAPRQVVDLRGAALTPRGDATLALYRLRDIWEALGAADRAYLVPMLRELVEEGGRMTDRPTPPGQQLGPFLDRLPEDRRRALLDHVGGGLFNARHASECVTDPGTRHHQTVPQLLTYLSEAIRELEAARALVAAAAEGGEVAG